MNFIDTHTHLFLKEFEDDIDNVIRESISSGVNKMLLPNINSKTISSMNDICKRFPENCFAMIGLHPCDVKKTSFESELDIIKNELLRKKYIAVGEIGIDLYWEKHTIDIQKKVFEAQINLAKQHNLPIVIHVRDSFSETIEIVERLNSENLSGVFHCFSGEIKDAERIIELENFFLGIGGVLTFKNSNLDKVIEKIDLDHIVLETDSPYLAPVPFRGKRNESKHIVNIASRLAEIKNTPLKLIAEITTQNAINLFNIP